MTIYRHEIDRKLDELSDKHHKYSDDPRTEWSFIAELLLRVEMLEAEVRRLSS